MEVLYGKPVADAILENTKNNVAKLKNKPTLAIITSGQDEASKVYIRNKVNATELCGMNNLVVTMKENSTTSDYIDTIQKLNVRKEITGIIVQLPLPNGIDEKLVTNTVLPIKDVDGFTPLSDFPPCTPSGIMSIIDFYKGKNFVEGKNAVVIGRSEIVGKPVAELLLNRNATVTICHSKTKNLKEHTKNADILVVAVGKAKFITKDMVKPGAVIVDVGINRENGKLCGDCDFENIKDVADITPVPGGVGPMTVATLVSRLPVMAVKQSKDIDYQSLLRKEEYKILEKTNVYPYL